LVYALKQDSADVWPVQHARLQNQGKFAST